MPALRGKEAVAYLQDRGLYDSLQRLSTSAMFSQLQKLTAPKGGENEFFGSSVAISGDTVVVGTPPVGAVYVFVRAGGLWVQQQKLEIAGGAFGISVAISGETLVAGAFAVDSVAGAAYVFVRTNGVWTQQQRLVASDRMANDNFGISVGISGDTAVVGARFHGAGPFPQQGTAYVFTRAGGVWSEQQHLLANDGGVGEFYGDTVAISGNTIVVGAAATSTEVPQQEHGVAYVYVRESDVWILQQRLLPPNTMGSFLFASSVTITDDTAVVGALFESAAYVFVRAGGVWSLQQRLTGELGEFGISASVIGDTLVVGARNERVGGNGAQGAAYVFVRDGGVWTQQQRLIAADGAANDRFGNSVGISGETIVIGSPFDQVGKNLAQGSAYLFAPNSLPTITASPVTVQQGRTLNGASIATVSDNESTASQLTVSVVSGGTATGVTLTNIANASGMITANVAASCTATSGTVRLGVTDPGGLTATADLQVNVTPNDPPVITCPGNIVKSTDPGQCSAVATFTATANDDCDGAVVPICAPPSGASFAKGITTVTCTASDTSGHSSSCTFTVTVQDTQSPVIVCPANLTVIAARPGDTTVIITYAAPMATDNCAVQSILCMPPSGSAFPLGTTTISCTATDTSGNNAGCSFSVTVFDVCLQDDASQSVAIVWNSVTGDYRFSCAGVIYTGRGVVARKGSVFTLIHNPADRRLFASVDSTQNKGTATLQAPPGANLCTINDRDIRNNSCQGALAAAGPPVN
jgi:hypothetical protein